MKEKSDGTNKGQVLRFPHNKAAERRAARAEMLRGDRTAYLAHIGSMQLELADKNARKIVDKFGSKGEVRQRMEQRREITTTAPIGINTSDDLASKARTVEKILSGWSEHDGNPEKHLELAEWWENHRKRESPSTTGQESA